MTTDPALVERVADVLEALDGGDLEDIARAVLDTITTSPRHALVELPEMQHGSFPVLLGGKAEDVYIQDTRTESIRVSGLDSFTPEEATDLAAALLAAARHAESTATEQE